MDKETDTKQQYRIVIVLLVISIFFLVLIAKLFYLQVEIRSEFDNKIIRQSIRKIRIPAMRGKIYTADGVVLADTIGQANLYLYINEIRVASREKTIDNVVQLIDEISLSINRQIDITREDITRHIVQKPGLPILICKDLTTQEMAIINNKIAENSALAIEIDSVRDYPKGNYLSHAIGYVGKDDALKAQDRNDFSYYIGDYIGKSGIEKFFDNLNTENVRRLRGYPGYSIVQVDNMGFARKTIIEELEPLHGNHVVLTIDSKAQDIVQKLMANQDGAMVVVDADNGDVLATVSAPDFNLEYFTPIVRGDYYKGLLDNKKRPLVNKATSGLFSPGSILKPLVALAILESGVHPEDVVNCDGTTKIGNAKINCTSHRYGGHGDVNVFKALERSCNDYFIEHGLIMGREKIYDILRSANLGKSPKLEIPASKGILPTEANKYRAFKNKWTAFDTGLVSIGQGIVTVSPIQAALYTAAFANGGKVYEPHLVKEIVDQNGNVLMERQLKVASRLAASNENIEAVKIGMFDVVNARYGSGRNAKVEGLQVYGKTGTAEIGSRANRRQNTWFVAFTEYQNRRYAVCVIIEDGKSGGANCAPLVKKFFEEYLLNKKR